MTQKIYAVTTPERLRALCCENGYFTEGSNAQYDALFEMNEAASAEMVLAMAGAIWICSDREKHTLDKIRNKLLDEGIKSCCEALIGMIGDGGEDDG